MQLSKPALDVGLYSNALTEQLAFWKSLGVPYSEMLPVGNGVRQHRHAIGQSVLKVNHAREALPAAPPCGLSALDVWLPDTTRLAQGRQGDPDGNTVCLYATEGEARLRLHLIVNDVDKHRHFYGTVLGLPTMEDENEFAVGESRICIQQGSVAQDPVQKALGYRYMTFQVFDVRREHQAVLDQGGAEGMAPLKLGDVAHISFIRDPDGNWIELSQRKSITGSLD